MIIEPKHVYYGGRGSSKKDLWFDNFSFSLASSLFDPQTNLTLRLRRLGPLQQTIARRSKNKTITRNKLEKMLDEISIALLLQQPDDLAYEKYGFEDAWGRPMEDAAQSVANQLNRYLQNTRCKKFRLL